MRLRFFLLGFLQKTGKSAFEEGFFTLTFTHDFLLKFEIFVLWRVGSFLILEVLKNGRMIQSSSFENVFPNFFAVTSNRIFKTWRNS